MRRPPDSIDPDAREWIRLGRTDQAALEEHVHAHEHGNHEHGNLHEHGNHEPSQAIPIEHGRYFAHLNSREMKAVYWQEPPWKLVRASWFFRDQSDRISPFGEADASTIEEAAEDIAAGREEGPIDVELIDTEGGGIVQVSKRLKVPEVVVSSDSLSTDPATVSPPTDSSIIPQPTTPSTPWKFWARSPEKLPALVFDYYVTTPDGVPRKLPVMRGYPTTTVGSDDETGGSPDASLEKRSISPPRWLIFITHGIGEALSNRRNDGSVGAIRFRKKIAGLRKLLNKVAKGKRASSSLTSQISDSRIELVPIEWLGATQSEGMQQALESVALPSLESARDFVNLAVRDVLLYTQLDWKARVLSETRKQINEKFLVFCHHNPGFKNSLAKGEAGVAFMGHSLGAVILSDLLLEDGEDVRAKEVDGNIDTSAGQSTLLIRPSVFFMLGSPVGLFRCVRGEFTLPRLPAKICFNIFHPHDPIAYRIEPLLKLEVSRSTTDDSPSSLNTMSHTNGSIQAPANVPYRGGHRLHVALSRFGTSLLNWWSGGSTEETESQGIISTNGGFRVDWTLQASPGEAASEWLSAVSSHFTYWSHEDVIQFMVDKLGEIGEKERGERGFI